jgi:hypothetical protein
MKLRLAAAGCVCALAAASQQLVVHVDLETSEFSLLFELCILADQQAIRSVLCLMPNLLSLALFLGLPAVIFQVL